MEKFKARYTVDDGYVGNRPHAFVIGDEDIEDDMDEDDIRDVFQRAMQEAFEQKIFPCSADEDAFVEWAKKQIAERQD